MARRCPLMAREWKCRRCVRWCREAVQHLLISEIAMHETELCGQSLTQSSLDVGVGADHRGVAIHAHPSYQTPSEVSLVWPDLKLLIICDLSDIFLFMLMRV
jgi:hypothetical protein